MIKKNVAVTRVSGSDDVFSSLSSKGAEKAVASNAETQQSEGLLVLLSDVAAEESACALVAALITYLLGLAL